MNENVKKACKIIDEATRSAVLAEVSPSVFYSALLEYLAYTAAEAEEPLKSMQSLRYGLERAFEERMKRKKESI